MIEAYINNIVYFLPSNIESNKKILRKISGDNKKNIKIFKIKSINENYRTQELGSLNFLNFLDFLDFLEFNDSNFKDFDFPVNKFRKCKTVGDLIKLYGNKIK